MTFYKNFIIIYQFDNNDNYNFYFNFKNFKFYKINFDFNK